MISIEVNCNEPSTALAALTANIFAVVEWYEHYAPVYPGTRSRRAQWFRIWMRDDGFKRLCRLYEHILRATKPAEVADSILATMSLGQLAMERDLDVPENVELVWQWAIDAIPSLEWALLGNGGDANGH